MNTANIRKNYNAFNRNTKKGESNMHWLLIGKCVAGVLLGGFTMAINAVNLTKTTQALDKAKKQDADEED